MMFDYGDLIFHLQVPVIFSCLRNFKLCNYFSIFVYLSLEIYIMAPNVDSVYEKSLPHLRELFTLCHMSEEDKDLTGVVFLILREKSDYNAHWISYFMVEWLA